MTGPLCPLLVQKKLFFPIPTTGPVYDAQVRAAKTVCAHCPVVRSCREEALARIPYGIAGGLTERERRALRSPRPGQRVCGLDETRETARTGRGLLVEGLTPRKVAERIGVSVRTAERWAAALRAEFARDAEAAS